MAAMGNDMTWRGSHTRALLRAWVNSPRTGGLRNAIAAEICVCTNDVLTAETLDTGG